MSGDSLTDYYSPEDIFNAIVLIRDDHNGTILITEGCDDNRLMKNFINTNCQAHLAYGKPNLLEVMKRLNGSNHVGIVALVDSDFWRINNSVPDDNNVIITEYHDMEVVLLSSKALSHVLAEYASKDKSNSIISKQGVKNILDLLLQSAKPIGALRYVSDRDQIGLCFKKLDISKIISKTTLMIDTDVLVTRILAQNQRNQLNGSLSSQLEEVMTSNICLLQLCCGHDLTTILGIALKNTIGNNKSDICAKENIEKLLRLSFDADDLKCTGIYTQMKKWEADNQPFKILAC